MIKVLIKYPNSKCNRDPDGLIKLEYTGEVTRTRKVNLDLASELVKKTLRPVSDCCEFIMVNKITFNSRGDAILT